MKLVFKCLAIESLKLQVANIVSITTATNVGSAIFFILHEMIRVTDLRNSQLPFLGVVIVPILKDSIFSTNLSPGSRHFLLGGADSDFQRVDPIILNWVDAETFIFRDSKFMLIMAGCLAI